MLQAVLHVVVDHEPAAHAASPLPAIAAGFSALATAAAAYSAWLASKESRYRRTRALKIGGGFAGKKTDRFALYLDNEEGRSVTIRAVRFVYANDAIAADPTPLIEPDWHIPTDGGLVVEYPLGLLWRQGHGTNVDADDSNPLRVVNVYTTSGHWFVGDLTKPLSGGSPG
jgi:hypothetical protein